MDCALIMVNFVLKMMDFDSERARFMSLAPSFSSFSRHCSFVFSSFFSSVFLHFLYFLSFFLVSQGNMVINVTHSITEDNEVRFQEKNPRFLCWRILVSYFEESWFPIEESSFPNQESSSFYTKPVGAGLLRQHWRPGAKMINFESKRGIMYQKRGIVY